MQIIPFKIVTESRHTEYAAGSTVATIHRIHSFCQYMGIVQRATLQAKGLSCSVVVWLCNKDAILEEN